MVKRGGFIEFRSRGIIIKEYNNIITSNTALLTAQQMLIKVSWKDFVAIDNIMIIHSHAIVCYPILRYAMHACKQGERERGGEEGGVKKKSAE